MDMAKMLPMRADNTARQRALYRLAKRYPKLFAELEAQERQILGLPPKRRYTRDPETGRER